MPRSRGTEMLQRQSPRVPSQLRTSSSDSTTDRSPKLGGTVDRRSPRGTQSDPPVNQKKLGTRIADLESQLGQAQVELKSLKDQLVSAEAAKKAAQELLEKKIKKPKNVVKVKTVKKDNKSTICEVLDETQQETDVFEVPIEPKVDLSEPIVEEESEVKVIDSSLAIEETELALKNDEIESLKAKLDLFREENDNLKTLLSDTLVEVSSYKVKEEEMSLKLSELTQVKEELEESKIKNIEVNEKLEATEKVKEGLEMEMKKLRIQTDQWRKAADAAASVLAGDMEMHDRRISERCGSMDKHYGGSNFFDQSGNYIGSPGLVDESEDVYGNGKRKGIRMFGDLWKKKGHK